MFRTIFTNACWLQIFFVASVAFSAFPAISSRNITRSPDVVEINPRFIGNSSYILYLEFTGNPVHFEPWEYRLMLVDGNGYSINPLTETGVIEYVVLPGELEVLLLVANKFTSGNALKVNFYNDIHHWEIQRFNIQTLEKTTVLLSGGMPIIAGYRYLGIDGLADWEMETLRSSSPKGRHPVVVRREAENQTLSVNFYSQTDCTPKSRFIKTDAFLTYSHFNWLPAILWLDDNSFITQTYQRNPQSESTFSIVKVDMHSGRQTLLHSDAGIKPFPALSLNALKTKLYFQKKSTHGNTELWRINLSNKDAEMIYETGAELGEARSSLDGTSLVFSKIMKTGSDIIRLDLEQTQITRLVDNH